MNTFYSMRRSDPLILLFATFVLLFDCGLGDEAETSQIPEIPDEPRSRIVFVNQVPPGNTVAFDFVKGATVYVASAHDEESQNYESNVHIHLPYSQNTVSLTEASKRMNEYGVKTPVFGSANTKILVTNTNMQKSSSATPGIIYFVTVSDGTHLSTVYETGEKREIYTESDHLGDRYVTLLNPSGAANISNIRNILGATQLTITAGGVEEAQDRNFTIYNVGSGGAHTKAPIIIPEPVITLRKQLAVFTSNFEFSVTGIEIPTDTVKMPMNWSDWTVAMSPNYMLRNESRSFKYVFNASMENTQYEVQMFGVVDTSSSLSIHYDGYDGAGSESVQGRHLDRDFRNVKGQTMIVEYKRGSNDKSDGVLVRVVCKQPASINLFYITITTVIIKYFLLQ